MFFLLNTVVIRGVIPDLIQSSDIPVKRLRMKTKFWSSYLGFDRKEDQNNAYLSPYAYVDIRISRGIST